MSQLQIAALPSYYLAAIRSNVYLFPIFLGIDNINWVIKIMETIILLLLHLRVAMNSNDLVFVQALPIMDSSMNQQDHRTLLILAQV